MIPNPAAHTPPTTTLLLLSQSRLTEYLHRQYCSNRAYYAAATLGGMMNPDQRITEDVEKFCFAVSDL